MTKQCKDVLKQLRKISNSTDDELCFMSGNSHICLYSDGTFRYDYSEYKGEIRSIIDWLAKDGYIEYVNNKYNFVLTHKGLHPCRITWDYLKTFLFRSIAIPIVVSALTTIVLSLISKIL